MKLTVFIYPVYNMYYSNFTKGQILKSLRKRVRSTFKKVGFLYFTSMSVKSSKSRKRSHPSGKFCLRCGPLDVAKKKEGHEEDFFSSFVDFIQNCNLSTQNSSFVLYYLLLYVNFLII